MANKKAKKKNLVKRTLQKTKKKTSKKPSTLGRILISLFSVIGVSVMGYLTTLHGGSGKSFCDVNEKLSCSAVNTSDYSELLGIPVSYLGLGFFLLILGLMLFRYTRNTLKAVVFMALVFLGPALYLTSLEIFVIDSICLFCELSKVLVASIAITGIFTLKLKKDDLKQLLGSGVLVGFLMAATTFMIFRITIRPVESGKYDEFAQNLTEEGWIMYGSATCQFCGRQREAFGEEAFEYIIEIECDPRNENDQAELCVAKRINHTPTWVLEDENGDTVEMLTSGMYPLHELSRLTGVEIPE